MPSFWYASTITFAVPPPTAVSLLPSTFTTSSLSEVIRIKSVIKSLNDGGEYTLTYGEKDYTFKVTDGKVTNISINPTQIAYQTAYFSIVV